MKKIRFDEWLTTVGFCAFLGIMSILFFVLPKQDMSETEKRVLEKAPEFSWEKLTSGELGSNIESYMADHVPARDFFVGLHNYTELLSGRQVTKDIYLAKGDRLVERPLVWDEKTGQQAQINVSAVNSLAGKVNVPVDMVIVPSAGWAVRDSIVGLSDAYTDPQLIQNIYAQAGENVKTYDLASVFGNFENPGKLYYKTDHHWTSLGAYTAYKYYMEMLRQPYTAQQNFKVETVQDFKGTTHSRAALWLVPGEPIEMWSGSSYITVSLDGGQPVNKVFFENRLEELDKYTVFLDGNHAQVVLENPNAPVDETLLVIRDSYSNCLGPFLAETYKRVVLLDLRYYNEAVVDYCTFEQVDRVLVLYSLYNFTTDTNFSKLGTSQNILSIAQKLPNEKLDEIAAFEGNYYDLLKTFAGGITRTAGGQYRVSYLGEGSVAVFKFDSQGTLIMGNVYATTCTFADLSELAVGDSMEKVQEIHPEGFFMYTDSFGSLAVSEHYTSDGVLVTIRYENDQITKITKEMI